MNKLNFLTALIPFLVLPLASAQQTNFTSYAGDLTNGTAMIVWNGKNCNLKFNSIEPAKSVYIAKDANPKHTVECNKIYHNAIDIMGNKINSDVQKINKQGKHCEKISNTIDEFRLCMGV